MRGLVGYFYIGELVSSLVTLTIVDPNLEISGLKYVLAYIFFLKRLKELKFQQPILMFFTYIGLYDFELTLE